LNAAVKCSGEEINMEDCVQLTEGGSMLIGQRPLALFEFEFTFSIHTM